MSDFERLAEAIRDVGFWNWWATTPSGVVQIELGGVQLAWPAPTLESVPTPLGLIALRFTPPTALAFLTRADAQVVPADWRSRLASDSLDREQVHTGISYEQLSLNDDEAASAVLAVPHTCIGPAG